MLLRHGEGLDATECCASVRARSPDREERPSLGPPG